MIGNNSGSNADHLWEHVKIGVIRELYTAGLITQFQRDELLRMQMTERKPT